MADFAFSPQSTNVEDRRGERPSIVKTLTGLYPNEWSKVVRHPFTPLNGNQSFPSLSNGDSQLAKDAGIDNIK